MYLIIKIVTIINGLIKRKSGIPADFMATISKVSPRLPNVIMDDSSKAKGKAIGIKVAATYKINFSMIIASNPLPTKSSMYSQKNCMMSTKMEIKKVAKNGPIKALIMSMSSFFITFINRGISF